MKVSSDQILLRQIDNDEGPWKEIRVQIRLPRVDGGLSLAGSRMWLVQLNDTQVPSASLADVEQRVRKLREHVEQPHSSKYK